MSQLQLVWWFMVVHGGLILLCDLVSNLIKSNAVSSDEFENQLKYNLRNKKGSYMA